MKKLTFLSLTAVVVVAMVAGALALTPPAKATAALGGGVCCSFSSDCPGSSLCFDAAPPLRACSPDKPGYCGVVEAQ
jgi:hypothetical protein